MSDLEHHSTSRPESRKEVVCAKCRHPNTDGSKVCSSCGARLYVTCHKCGHRMERVLARCSHCGQRLHRSTWRRLQKQFFPDQRKYKPFHFVLLVVMVYLAYKIIIRLVEYEEAPPS